MTGLLAQIGRTPLVRLERIGAGLRVPVLVKCEHLNPGGSVKDRIALAIVDDAEARGALRPGMTLIEATAGNTGLGLALVAAARGYALVCVMPEKMSVDKRAALAAVGARVVITPNAPPSSPDNFRRVAERMAAEHGWFLTDQFNNPANVRVHERTTAVEILAQTGARVGAFVAGAGTGGTISGVGRVLKAAVPGVRIVLADPIGSGLADWVESGQIGADGSYAVEGIGGSEAPTNLHRDVIDAAERVADADSFEMTRRLVREEGLLSGGSAGTNVVAALRIARRGDVDGPVVTILPDAWDRYRAQPWMRAWTDAWDEDRAARHVVERLAAAPTRTIRMPSNAVLSEVARRITSAMLTDPLPYRRESPRTTLRWDDRGNVERLEAFPFGGSVIEGHRVVYALVLADGPAIRVACDDDALPMAHVDVELWRGERDVENTLLHALQRC